MFVAGRERRLLLVKCTEFGETQWVSSHCPLLRCYLVSQAGEGVVVTTACRAMNVIAVSFERSPCDKGRPLCYSCATFDVECCMRSRGWLGACKERQLWTRRMFIGQGISVPSANDVLQAQSVGASRPLCETAALQGFLS